MLFVLIGLMLLSSMCLLLVKKNRESLYLLGMCFALLLQFSGILIFIAKKGGYTQDMLRFLYFSIPIKNKIQYLFITLDQMGYLIALGRYLFPMFLLQSALYSSTASFVHRRPQLRLYAAILPVLSLILYYPQVFRPLTTAYPVVQNVLVQVSYYWILAYAALAALLLLCEFKFITIRYFRWQFAYSVVNRLALCGLYLIYFGQDPAQVYRFYSFNYPWGKGLGYLQLRPTITGFVVLVVVNLICAVLGFVGLLRYTRDTLRTEHEETVLERKFDVARTGASVFVHSIKNQLLANRVLEKHIYQELNKENPDLTRIRECVDHLHANNEMLLSRSSELYQTVKSKSVRLTPVALGAVREVTLQRFRRKYPDALVDMRLEDELYVLADLNYFSEALYNLLINAWEANMAAGRMAESVTLSSRQERLYTVLEVRDCGEGMGKREIKRVFEPFYSSKNSNTAWGMGLYHTRTIIRAHLGQMRIESELGKGSSFMVLLPRYEAARQVKKA